MANLVYAWLQDVLDAFAEFCWRVRRGVTLDGPQRTTPVFEVIRGLADCDCLPDRHFERWNHDPGHFSKHRARVLSVDSGNYLPPQESEVDL